MQWVNTASDITVPRPNHDSFDFKKGDITVLLVCRLYHRLSTLGLDSLSGRTSYRKISWNLEGPGL